MDSSDFAKILESVRTWVHERVLPLEDRIESDDCVPDAVVQEAKDMGLFGFALPAWAGGLGLSMSEEVRLVFELGYTTPALRSLFGTNNGIAGQTLVHGATRQQQRDHLPAMATGERIASFALTEEAAGSDPASLRTLAVRDGSGWILNGSKRYITNAPVADLFVVFARTDTQQTSGRGISVFLVPSDRPGLSVGPKDGKMGQRGAWTADVHFADVRLSDDQLLGGQDQLNNGYRLALSSLGHGRLHIAALCTGLIRRLIDEARTYANERIQGGRPISQHQLILEMLADMSTDYRASRALVLDAADLYDQGADTKVGPAQAKYFASEALARAADRAVQIHGGSGYMHGVPVERFYRDARLFRIYEGTSEIQKLIIGRAATQGNIGLPVD
ncbi:acyl-CoA dehydrogenase family protein [Nakamurella lactea]|uniref:acyl-CoA dehydrogenase family protein n=1 Tax=Nakamurella lactea TaxID=459515 RepID=UPI0003F91C08|nr:acyl-CoA dehydrogenase family protein [Nakamurella lactea]